MLFVQQFAIKFQTYFPFKDVRGMQFQVPFKMQIGIMTIITNLKEFPFYYYYDY